MRSETVGKRMQNSGFTRGFDYLRLVLALGIVVWHAFYVLTTDTDYYTILHRSIEFFGARLLLVFLVLKALILPMFFALSGFLVAGSLERSKTIEGFATLRILRIGPALAIEVLLSAFLLGPLLTNFSVHDYFFDAKFYQYLLNTFGDIHFLLPGVFTENLRPNIVNLSLWTVPYELECYLALMLLAISGICRKRHLFAALTIAINLSIAVYYLIGNSGRLSKTLTMPGPGLVVCFLMGLSIYLYRDRIPLRLSLAILAAVSALALMTDPRLMAFAAIPAAYLTVWLGLLNPPRLPVLMSGDYSYGIYLFAFPIQQAMATIPALQFWPLNACATVILSFFYAAFSWHFVEKPVLSRKSVAVKLVERFGRVGRRRVRAIFGLVHQE